MRGVVIAAVVAAAFAFAAQAGGPGSAPEPDGLWRGALAGYTPSTLKGATVVDAAAVARLVDKGDALLLDVGPADRKPETLPETALWRPQHRSIPGAVWLPGAGPGDLPPEQEAALKARIMALADGDLGRPVVTFCKPDCWGSWNLGKRLLGWGFTSVQWFPGGINGWLEADRPSTVVRADPDWEAATKPPADR
ncbi:MAG TPA: rhodanese-like domain-containing protein [Hansschlegelia sp.]